MPHADIWSSARKRHFPPSVQKNQKKTQNTPITVDCNCQSFRTVTMLTVAPCEVLPLCLSSPTSACVARRLSDVGLIHYMGCIPQAHAQTRKHTDGERQREGEKDTKALSLLSADSDPIYSVNMFFTS